MRELQGIQSTNFENGKTNILVQHNVLEHWNVCRIQKLYKITI